MINLVQTEAAVANLKAAADAYITKNAGAVAQADVEAADAATAGEVQAVADQLTAATNG